MLHTLHYASSIKCAICTLMQVVCSFKTPACLIKVSVSFTLPLMLNMSADHQICWKNHLFCCAVQRQLIYLSAHIWGYITLF
jgi:LSD1 subclass zinc finger protein